MPLLHCCECHHEWEDAEKSECRWCGAESYVLADETMLEWCIRQLIRRESGRTALRVHDLGK